MPKKQLDLNNPLDRATKALADRHVQHKEALQEAREASLGPYNDKAAEAYGKAIKGMYDAPTGPADYLNELYNAYKEIEAEKLERDQYMGEKRGHLTN